MNPQTAVLAVVVLLCFGGGYWLVTLAFNSRRPAAPSTAQPLQPGMCVFCGSPAGLAEVLPPWLIARVAPEEAPAPAEGRVCGGCQRGWIGLLDAAAQTALPPLIDGSRRAAELSDTERILLARWAAKRAFLLTPSPVAAHARELAASPADLPAAVAVFMHQAPAPDRFDWTVDSSWPRQTSGPLAGIEVQERAEAYKIALSIGALMFVVAHWPEPGWRFVGVADLHKPLWPRFATLRSYMPAETAVEDPAALLRHFCRWLAVSR